MRKPRQPQNRNSNPEYCLIKQGLTYDHETDRMVFEVRSCFPVAYQTRTALSGRHLSLHSWDPRSKSRGEHHNKSLHACNCAELIPIVFSDIHAGNTSSMHLHLCLKSVQVCRPRRLPHWSINRRRCAKCRMHKLYHTEYQDAERLMNRIRRLAPQEAIHR